MYRYIILNLAVLSAISVLLIFSNTKINLRRFIKTAAVLVIMTIVFDNIMISLNLFEYNTNYILGLYIGKAPVEDFVYSIVAAIIVPFVWEHIKQS